MRRFWLPALALSLLVPLAGVPVSATHGEPHATIEYWDVGSDPVIMGYDPHETTEDIEGVTGHVATPDAPLTLVTSMENTRGGFCGPLYWNPATNVFKTYPVTGGFQAATDVNREAPAITSGSATFGPGDAWFTVQGNYSYGLYVNFRNSDNFRLFGFAYNNLGVRVNQATGLVYTASFWDGALYELDPATGGVRSWSVGNRPYWLDIADNGDVYTAAAASGGYPDQILRLTPGSGAIRRWNIPGGGLQSYVSFGMPNGVRLDPEGNLWFSQTTANTVSRLRVADDEVDQYTKPGITDPNGVAASGSGAALQAFFTERAGEMISLVTPGGATPTTTAVAPADSVVPPYAYSASVSDLTIQPFTTTITPTAYDSPGEDPPGIVRFPAPPGTYSPAGISNVAAPGTIFGSFEGSDHVFGLTSDAIIAPPAGKSASEGYAARADIGPLTVDTGKLARSTASGAGASDSDQIAGETVPGTLSIGVGRTTASSDAQGDLLSAGATSTVATVDIGAGLVTADLVRAEASVEFDKGAGTGTTSSDGSGFVNLSVDGEPVSDDIAPNTQIPISGVGTVTLREEIPVVGTGGASLQVNMIHFRSDDGTVDVVVSSAFASAGSGSAIPPDPQQELPSPPEVPIPDVSLFSEGFEAGAPGWTVETDSGSPAPVWEIGAPSSGPGSAAEGANVAATILAGSYPSGARARLVSPSIDLRRLSPEDFAAAGKRVVLRYKQWFQAMAYDYDCGWLTARRGAAPAQVIAPDGDYPVLSPWCDSAYPPGAYAGDLSSGGWSEQVFDVTEFVGSRLTLVWNFRSYTYSYYYGSYPGWYVDDVRITAEDA